MKLKSVTFTGIDDATDLDRVAQLSWEYPFVEWGVLMSATRTGIDPRYPSLATMAKVSDIGINPSVHLCGRLARDLAEVKGFSIQAALQFNPGARRIQVNLGRAVDQYDDLFYRLRSRARHFGVQIIMQAYGFDSPSVMLGAGVYSDDVVFLNDASGGEGIAGDFQAPVSKSRVGFAGGICPENVLAKIEQVNALPGDNEYWIDMESGVRTGNLLDLDKCEAVLKIAKHCIQ